MKRILLLTGLLALLPLAGYARTDGACYPTSGVPQQINMTATGNVPAEKMNPSTSAFQGAFGNSNTKYAYTCECSNPGATAEWWTGTSDYPTGIDGYGQTVMKIFPSLNIVVQSYIWTNISGGNYTSVPFGPLLAQSRYSCDRQGSTSSASGGRLTIYVAKPFIGSLAFSGPVGKIYLTKGVSRPIDATDEPMGLIYLDMNLSVPNNCTVRPGGVINVNLGQNIRASQFRGQPYPQPPKSYTARNIDLTFDCDFSNADVDVTLVGNRDTQQQGFASSSPDISVIVANKDGSIIPPQSNAGYVTVGSDKVSNTLHLKAWPTNSGSAATPEASSYTATATILVSYR